MNRIKYLLVFCIVTVIVAASISDIGIRFNTTNQQAQAIYGSVDYADVPVINDIDPNILIDDHQEQIQNIPKVEKVDDKPYISAESYLVANLQTGERYIEHNTNKVFPIASVSKLYTSLVVHHLFKGDQEITITQSMLDSYGDAGKLVLNEKFTPDELLYALLLESSNDAALAFAESFGYEDFIDEMNGFAYEIGMHRTHFHDPSGLSPLNGSSVDDLFILSKYLYQSESNLLKISRTDTYDLASSTMHGEHRFKNINPFSRNSEFVGGKTGRTNEAKESMVSIFDHVVGGVKYPIVVILLRSEFGEREENTVKLLNMFNSIVGRSI